MPTAEQFKKAINWSLQQEHTNMNKIKIMVTKENHHLLVDYVSKFFNDNNIEYPTFSYADLESYLPQ